MDPRSVQYVRTADGCSIAYNATGSGEPIVWLPQLFANFREMWTRNSFIRPWAEALAEKHRLVMYDSRNQGSSTRSVSIASMADYEADLEAVVDRLNLGRFTLMATDWFNHVAVRYAARNPERVQSLVLSSASIDNKAWPMALFDTLAADDYDAFLRSQVAVGQSTDIQGALRFLKQTTAQEDWLSLVRAAAGSDVTDVLPAVSTPALVLHARDFFNLPPEESMRFASAMPRARFVEIDGAQGMGNPVQGITLVESFLDENGPETEPAAADTSTSLSARELEVLRLVAAGKTNDEIAEALVISRNTVRRHVSNLFDKTGVSNRTQAASYARDHGLI